MIISSWFPTNAHPFLGNFVEYQSILLSSIYKVTFLRLLPDESFIKTLENKEVNYLDVYFKKSKNPFITRLNKKKAVINSLKNLDSVDLIHAHISYPDGWLFRLVKKKLNKPLVLTEHASYYSPNFKWSLLMKYDISKTLKVADVVLSVSTFLANDIRHKFPSVKLNIVGNPVDITRFNIKDKQTEAFNFLHVSTLDKVKNVDGIIEAFIEVNKKKSNTKLTIISDEDHKFYQEKVRLSGVEDSIVFLGPINHTEMNIYYSNADCLVMNSNYESFSIVIVEAWSCGIPIISTPVGVASELSSDLGILTDGTNEKLVLSMLEMIDNVELFNSKKIREYSKQFSNENFLLKIEQIYQRFI